VFTRTFRALFFHHQRGYRSLAFVLVGAISLGTYAFVARIPDGSIPGWVLQARRAAVQTAERGQEVLAQARAARGLSFNPGDQFQSGIIGTSASPVTTDLGSLPSHRTATNPVFAAAVVQMLYRAGVRRGDLVAVGETGSYPGFNLDVDAGIEAVGAVPVVISSVGASQYGANEPSFTWQDMESVLYGAGVIHHRSIAVAAGGSLAGTSAQVRLQLAEATGLPVLPVLPLSQEIKFREHLYVSSANQAGLPIAAFVNVGGSAANVGTNSGEAIIAPGFSRPRWSQFQASRLGVVGWMALRSVPIIAMIDVARLAHQFAIPFDPRLPPSAQDIPAPPANPVGLAVALVGLIGLVVAAHRLGFFRVPDWELPLALRQAALTPTPGGSSHPPLGLGAPDSPNGQGSSLVPGPHASHPDERVRDPVGEIVGLPERKRS
jgi:poly-gamma-glutamate system protein